MSASGARRGRRDNGLDAADYAVAGDVDPRVGEHLLDVLAAGGIAAYLQPSADLNPVTRTTTVPPRPIDRLYVDRAHLATARDYLAQLADEGSPGDAPDAPAIDPDIEAEWARIVAGYDTEIGEGATPWPEAEDLDDADPPRRAEEDPADQDRDRPGPGATGVRGLPSAADYSGVSVNRPDERSLLDGLDTFGAHLPDSPGDPEARYTPPPPPPLPPMSKVAVASVLAIAVGFALFLFPNLLPVNRGLTTAIGFTGILGGFVTLVWRLRPGTDEEEDDPDDGAVV